MTTLLIWAVLGVGVFMISRIWWSRRRARSETRIEPISEWFCPCCKEIVPENMIREHMPRKVLLQ